MQKTKLIIVSIFGQFICLSSSYANTQIEGNGFTDGASASILLRNGWIYRDRTNGRHNYNSWGQSAIGKFNTGFTQGPIGYGAELLGDVGFKIGDNKHAGNQMIPHNTNGEPYSNWMRGGANVKVKVSETTLTYGTQFLNIPVLGSGDARLSPEYFTGTLLNSKDIKDLDINIGYFTKNQQPDQIASDQSHLKRAIIYGGKYRINDHIDTSFYNADWLCCTNLSLKAYSTI
ncbi:TPA: OprD family outer membrane porin [Acinetobacter baumannii]|uniref:OprD family outer membrane porin n=3 Tax=Acinetobacter baumannii TaxID=470 RepID=UPI00264705B1|nr:OprD family outer membrane porin [Acinetobacter baumannii]MCZ2937586.1 OprD family porin [Acinetobacter baumannii]MCZ2959944.1 OprD family porin [Acinetobacter baumannii]MCZ3069675.1 OprD family porin [Acinetobacter baumannii]MDQ8879921.1 OprD family outer membrane porin [Acinetobacter baumannii]MDQ8890942.1 OprD family outer membrane porin [Acinetobacter baumannii]